MLFGKRQHTILVIGCLATSTRFRQVTNEALLPTTFDRNNLLSATRLEGEGRKALVWSTKHINPCQLAGPLLQVGSNDLNWALLF